MSSLPRTPGEFSQGELDNTSYALDDLTTDSCADIIREKLVFSGTYSSSGTNDAPNIKNGNCSTSPNGAVYAIGNYLNYLQYDPWNASLNGGLGCYDDDLDNVCDDDDVCRGYMDDFPYKTYAEIEAAYASYGMTVPASFMVGVDERLYDMDNDGVPNGLPGSMWPNGCDLCLSGDDSQDQDFDTIPDACDQCGLPIDCPTCSGAYFDDSIDADNNGTPDCMEADADGDGIVNGIDVCVGANTSDDADGDGVPDDCDAFPADPNEAIDSDGDGVGDESDACPGFPDSNDFDADGTPDGCDADIDNDGIPNANDNCPAYNSVDADQTDTDHDGAGDLCDDDLDGDGFDNINDNCPGVRNEHQVNSDKDQPADIHGNIGDDQGDACDTDDDADGVPDDQDACPGFPDWQDDDGDDVPDGCDSFVKVDTDGDGVVDSEDNCPDHPNTDQKNSDVNAALPYISDELGDACDEDDDGDGVLDYDLTGNPHSPFDNCQFVPNPGQENSETLSPLITPDAKGDACDDDDDNDGVKDMQDVCAPTGGKAGDDTVDADNDNVPDDCDDNGQDADGDGAELIGPAFADNCPMVANNSLKDPQLDFDGDGQGDACDNDDDNDLVLDVNDNCPRYNNTDTDQTDTDGDGQGDVCDDDDDNDGKLDGVDNCPWVYNPDQDDIDNDQVLGVGGGDACDNNIDRDGDGVADEIDNCLVVKNGNNPGEDNQADTDGDGVGNACDSLIDTDGDGIPNDMGGGFDPLTEDNCPDDPNKDQLDKDGDYIGNVCDNDDDGDGVLDVDDNCPLEANPTATPPQTDDNDGDGLGDAMRPR